MTTLQALEEVKNVAFGIGEPGCLAYRGLGNAILSLQAVKVVFLEDDAPAPQSLDLGADVIGLRTPRI